jgi:hypothetical protein
MVATSAKSTMALQLHDPNEHNCSQCMYKSDRAFHMTQAASAPGLEERVKSHNLRNGAPAPSLSTGQFHGRLYNFKKSPADELSINPTGYQRPSTCRPPQIQISTSIHCGTSQCGGGSPGQKSPLSSFMWDVDGGRYIAGAKSKVKL